jgi:hypothetical protein
MKSGYIAKLPYPGWRAYAGRVFMVGLSLYLLSTFFLAGKKWCRPGLVKGWAKAKKLQR